jgi:3-deoxy-7-phosphoheptulonate synthase
MEMTNHENEALGRIRAEIDRLDDQILELIERRLAASAATATVKQLAGRNRLRFRPRRQAEVIERLKKRARHAPAPVVSTIWRELMGYGLQAQGETALILCGSVESAVLEAHVRSHFGHSFPILWAAGAEEALRRALDEEAVAIVAGPLPPLDAALSVFDLIRAPEGDAVAHAVGRVALQDRVPCLSQALVEASSLPAPSWLPSSWRRHRADQLPFYPDAEALGHVERQLHESRALVPVSDIVRLQASLARVAAGDGFLLQGGDCAESFEESGAGKVLATFDLLRQMGSMLCDVGGKEVVHLARIAGQFAKPRSSAEETVDGVTLPSYRGDAVNGTAFTVASRTPDPERLLQAHRQSRATIDLVRGYAAPQMFTSHEALLLNYEQALTRFDEQTGRWWATSAHMVWIGDRTRSLEGAHVEYARGIANPVGLKCGPSLSPDDLLRLIDKLDPDNQAGRLVLIGRFGATKVGDHLPRLMRATQREGRKSVWAIDPMHGNTRTVGTVKTRLIRDLISETEAFFEIARAERVHAGGIHLEMTGADVTECLGGSSPVTEEDLSRRYLSRCDPRLNQRQALDVAAAAAALLARNSLRSDAA